MNFKTSLLAASVALVLAGCGSDDSTNTTTPSSITVKAIDGYLANAEVCVDRNDNGSCESEEVLNTLTNAEGEVQITKADVAHNIIVTAKASITSDSDKGGKLGNDFQYIVNANANISNGSTINVTPFTTLAYVNDMTLEEVAADLNLPIDAISGDYVSMAQDTENEDATKVHAVARSVTGTLPAEVKIVEKEALNASVATITEKVESIINAGENLDKVNIELDEKGQAVTKPIYTLDSYFSVGEKMWSTSLNKAYATYEGIDHTVITTPNKMTTLRYNTGEEEIFEFNIEGDDLTGDEGNERDTFIYLSHDVSIAVPHSAGDMILWSKKDIRNQDNVYNETFSGKTFFFISDDSTTNAPDPMMAKMVFGDSEVVISEDGETMLPLTWEITAEGSLLIDFPEGDNDMNFKVIAKDRNIMVTEDMTVNNMFGLFITNESMANSLMKKWTSI
ncbi:hypothetical protein L4D06_17025 [Enterovibrio makurazakiensis]|uniref:hypothetical protein n=1 Tax=Enterovibrio makurazakiensis TaxID=2910232 RepID=UPI003D1BF9AD